MQMSKFKQTVAMVILFLIALAFFGQFGKNGQTTTLLPADSQGIQAQQASLVPLENQWELIQFQNEAVEIDGIKYDKGWFKNLATGEVIEARCLNRFAADPSNGDKFFFNSEGELEKIGGGGQKFEKTFQVLPTATLTIEPLVTSTATVTTQEAVSEKTVTRTGSTFTIPPSWLPWICIGLIVLVLTVIVYIRIQTRD